MEIGDAIYNLFSDEEFRHWFFWTAILVGIFTGWPAIIRVKNSVHKCCKGKDN